MSKRSLRSRLVYLGKVVFRSIRVYLMSLLVVMLLASNGWYQKVDTTTGELVGTKVRTKDTLDAEFWEPIFETTNFADFLEKTYKIGYSSEVDAELIVNWRSIMDLDLDSPSENLDYTLEALSVKGSPMWNVSLMRSPYENVTIRYRNVTIDESSESIRFNFDVIDTPDESVYNTDNIELQVLQQMCYRIFLRRLVYNKGIQSVEGNDDGDQPTTDDSTESTD